MKGSEQKKQEMLTLRLREKRKRRVCPCTVCSIIDHATSSARSNTKVLLPSLSWAKELPCLRHETVLHGSI